MAAVSVGRGGEHGPPSVTSGRQEPRPPSPGRRQKPLAHSNEDRHPPASGPPSTCRVPWKTPTHALTIAALLAAVIIPHGTVGRAATQAAAAVWFTIRWPA